MTVTPIGAQGVAGAVAELPAPAAAGPPGEGASAQTPRPGWDAALDLVFQRRDATTVVARRRHCGPLRVQQPFYPEGPGVCHVIIVHPPGGIADGDCLAVSLEAEAGAALVATTPGAGKWYKSVGRESAHALHLRAAAGACIEWLPQENIFFQSADCRLTTRVELAAGATAMGREILCFGRSASGERFQSGCVRLASSLSIAGRLVWFEQGMLGAGETGMTGQPGLGGRSVYAGFWAAGRPVPDALLEACRALPTPGAQAGISVPGAVLLARYLGDSSEAARQWTEALWRLLRPHFAQRPAHALRIWNT